MSENKGCGSCRKYKDELQIAQAVIEDLETIIEDMEKERAGMMGLMETIFSKVQIKQAEITKGGNLKAKKGGVVKIEKSKISTFRDHK